MEIITGIERRRRWRDEDKLRIVAEAEAPGAVFAEVARRHDISRGQLWSWRRLVRSGELSLVSAPTEFLPVHVVPALSAAAMIGGPEDAARASGSKAGSNSHLLRAMLMRRQRAPEAGQVSRAHTSVA